MQARDLIPVYFGLSLSLGYAYAAPDEDRLGRGAGYPVGKPGKDLHAEHTRVGTFSHYGEIPGIFNGNANVMRPSTRPMALPKATEEPAYRWRTKTESNLTVDDYLSRQRVMGLLVIMNGVVQLERYQYERTPQHRFLSNSMAKTITAIGIGIALQEGKIHSLDDLAQRYEPGLNGTQYGQTTIRNLLRMSSGVRFLETGKDDDDMPSFAKAIHAKGVVRALAEYRDRDTAQGTTFKYSSPETAVLGAVLARATGTSLSSYLERHLWQPIGAEQSALWRADKTGLEVASGNLSATLRDYGRLGIVLANDGVRPDDSAGRPIIPRDFLMEMTDWHRQPMAFHPRVATPFYGYGYQTWLFPSKKRRFALIGVYGQIIIVDPEKKLVLVQTAANSTRYAGHSSLFSDIIGLWSGILRFYGE